jgi:hypothetical protein
MVSINSWDLIKIAKAVFEKIPVLGGAQRNDPLECSYSPGTGL